jgi:hypothetical protein
MAKEATEYKVIFGGESVSQQEETKFEQWVRRYGVSNLVHAMHALGPDYAVTFSAIYQWIRGQHEPRPAKIRGVVKIADGALTLEDVHQHFEITRAAWLARGNAATHEHAAQ